jgi:LacI family gluconate utilization system Gnt-I transcriptional repressor
VRQVPRAHHLGSGRAGLAELLAQVPELDAVFCSSDLLAWACSPKPPPAASACPAVWRWWFGDLAFAGDTHPRSARAHRRHRHRAARRRFIVARAEGAEVNEKVVDLGFQLIERAST